MNIAVKNNHYELVKIFIEDFQISVNTPSEIEPKNTPLIDAMLLGYDMIFKLLLENGADYTSSNDKKENIFIILKQKIVNHDKNSEKFKNILIEQASIYVFHTIMKKGGNTMLQN